MIALQRSYARRLTGRLVRVACANGACYRGRLIGFNGDSLWLVASGRDVFVEVSEVVALAPASF